MIQFIKTRDVKSPIRNEKENAGIDLFVPENTEEFREALKLKNPNLHFNIDTGVITLLPHEDIIIPSGIRSKFPNNLALIANNKSGIATKKKLIFGASVIDSSYQGEWHLHLINTSDFVQEISCGQKIIQFIPHIIDNNPIEVLDLSEDTFFKEKTARGEGWQGSTGV